MMKIAKPLCHRSHHDRLAENSVFDLRLGTALILGLFTSLAWSAENRLPLYVPPGIDLMAPPSLAAEKPTVFIQKNSAGENIRQVLSRTADGVLIKSEKVISDNELTKLAEDYTIVNVDAEPVLAQELARHGASPQSSQSGTCPLPTEFSIVGDSDGKPMGDIIVPGSGNPPGTTTQWVLFDFYTYKYRLAKSHVPIVLRHKEIVHGWGSLIGDNHESWRNNIYLGCGNDSRFNSQIEGFFALAPEDYDPEVGLDPEPEESSTWQAMVYRSSCGAEMYDGPVVIYPPYYTARYRMMIHAASSHWVAYQVQEWSTSSGWTILTSWTDLDTDQPDPVYNYDWPVMSPAYDNDAGGIMIAATESQNNTANWAVHFSNVDCGWF